MVSFVETPNTSPVIGSVRRLYSQPKVGMAARLAAEGPALGWTLQFPDRHPHAGGPDHYAAYLANTDGFEVELVADDT
jgi:hypothetical protein